MHIQPIKSALRDLVLLTRKYNEQITAVEDHPVPGGMTFSQSLQALHNIKTEFLKEVNSHARSLFFLFATKGDKAWDKDFKVNEEQALAARYLLTKDELALFETVLSLSLLEKSLERENDGMYEVQVEDVEDDLDQLISDGLRVDC